MKATRKNEKKCEVRNYFSFLEKMWKLLFLPIFHFITQDNLPVRCVLEHDHTCVFVDSLNVSTSNFQLQEQSLTLYSIIHPNATFNIMIAKLLAR
jgi:hypothetical protein